MTKFVENKLKILPQPLKVHIMLEHVNTFVERVGGGLSKRGNDQVTEAAHQLLHQRMTRSHYWVRKVGSESEGKALFRAVIHTQCVLMGNVGVQFLYSGLVFKDLI